MNDKIVMLDEASTKGIRGSLALRGSTARFAHADLVIDHDGRVIKNRYGHVGQDATPAEIKAATVISLEDE